MGRMNDISENAANQAFDLPGGVHIVAQATMLTALEGLAGHVTAIACGTEDPLPLAELANASMVVIEVDPTSRNSLDRVDELRSQWPHLPVIAGLAKVDIATSRQLLRRGVSDIVALPFTVDELVTSIVDTAQKELSDKEANVRLAPFIAMIKSIGGAGSTTIATHLAAQLAHDMGEGHRACVIDLDLQSGDVASYLGCTPKLTLADLVDTPERLDDELVRSVTTSGHDLVDIVAAPADIVPIESIDFDQLMRVITIARRNYDVVIVDLPASFTNWSLSTVFAANLSLIVGALTIPSLRHAKRQLDFLVSMGIAKSAISIVLNRVEKGLFKSISANDAAEALKHPILATVSDEQSLLRAAQDQGQLVYALQKRSKFSKDIMRLSELVSARMAEVD